MPLDTAEVKRRLSAAPSDQMDNEAQNIINGASSAELANLDVEGVLRLYEALALLPPRWYSSRDKAAMERLQANTQFQPVINTPDYGVDLVRNAGKTKNQTLVTAQLVKNIYAAENSRLSGWERIGIDGATIGRGQLGEPAYTDVKNKFATELEACVSRVFIAELFTMAPNPFYRIDFPNYKAKVPLKYGEVILYPAIEDFVVAAYLAILVDRRTKAGRPTPDTLRFAVAFYHGMSGMVIDAQKAAGDEINWSPVETQLNSQGYTDEVNYVNEAVK
jgi:hypothetical protein